MAISTNQSILSLLKVYYKDGIENLMFRNSPVLKKIKKDRVEGKTVNYAAMYGRGGAVSGDFTVAQSLAETVSKNVEFSVAPGQLFSVYTMNAKEVQASKTQRGAYMKVAGAKLFASAEGFRKTLAASLYGTGHGELCALGSLTNNTLDSTGEAWAGTGGYVSGLKFKLPWHAIMAIDVGTKLDVYSGASSPVSFATPKAQLTVTAINGQWVSTNLYNSSSTTSAAGAATDIFCIGGCSDTTGNALLPVGLAGWLPNGTAGNERAIGSATFMGVDRSVAADRLAGAYYDGSSASKYTDVVQNLLQIVRRQGSTADMIVMNDSDFLAMSKEIESTNTYFTETSTKSKRKANVGFDEFSASFSTNYIENIVDDPYCPKGVFYILEGDSVEFDTLTNVDKVNDGIAANDPGKPDPMTENNEGYSDVYHQLLIDDYINVQAGQSSVGGPSVQVTLMMFGSFIVLNPSVCGVGLLPSASSNDQLLALGK